MEWLVELRGDPYDLEALSRASNSLGYLITKGEQGYTLKSQELNRFSDEGDVRTTANHILSQMNGVSFLTIGMRVPIEIHYNAALMLLNLLKAKS
jgi:hypothetical protein